MVSLLAESYGNNILLEGNLNNTNSNIKKIIQSFLNRYQITLFSLYNLNKNLHIESKLGDIFYSFYNSKEYIEVLENRGYKKTNNFFIEKYNYIYSNKEVGYFKRNGHPFKDNIDLTNNNGIINNYSYFVKDNYIIFYSNYNYNTDFYYHLSNSFELLDFKIDSEKFVYILYKRENKTFLSSSHLSSNFIDLNKENSKINIDQLNFNIEVPDDCIEISYIDNFVFYLMNKEYKFYQMEFEKLYYFEYDGKILFNYVDALENYKDQFISVEQIEELQIYNNINIYGLNDFLIDGNLKISTNFLKLFKELLINKFDNTLNGGLNYFNYREYGELYNFSNKNTVSKDYSLNYNNENIHINGNFYYSKKGNFKIVIRKSSIALYKEDKNGKYIFEKEIKYSSQRELYFCNLYFFIKKNILDSDYIEEISISNFDSYPFFSGISSYEFDKIPNNSKVIDLIIEQSTFSDDDIKNNNCYFDGNSIVFNNIYDYKNNKFIYLNKKITVKPNDNISLNEISLFNFNNIYEIKDNKIYFRNKGIFNYSSVNQIKFDLINSKGYITDFWIKNQGKTLYFKNTSNGVIMTNNLVNSDYYMNIPLIEDYINYSDTNFLDVYIEDTDDLSIEKEYSENLLITDKFFVEPLFYKFFIATTSLDTFKLYDDSYNEIYYLSEAFKNGYIIYFNAKNKKYFYNLGESKYNYIQPIKSYENIETNYYFDENNTIHFSQVEIINSFKLKSSSYVNGNINIYLYNTVKGLTYRIQLTSNELNTKFDLNLEVDKIKIESSSNNNEFVFIEESGDSLIVNNKINFFKKNRSDVVYIANLSGEINFKNIDFSKIKINKKYNINGSSFVESFNGKFYINKPFKNSIAVYTNNNFSSYNSKVFMNKMLTNDSFYNNNFKTPGNFYKSYYKKEDISIKSYNKNFNINDIN